MSYRKFKADYLFDGFSIVPGKLVLICHPDGTVEGLVNENDAGEGVEAYSGLLSPGFINCHCHLELSHLKGRIPEKTGLVDFVFAVMQKRNQPLEERLDAILVEENNMFRSGIVAVGDICNSGDTLTAKASGRMHYYNFIELLGWMPDQAMSRYEAALALDVIFGELGSADHHSINPHAPYSVSGALWELMKPGFPGKTITMHNQESEAENELFLTGSGDLNRMYSAMKIHADHFTAPGTSSLEFALPRLKSASRILLVHNTYTGTSDLRKATPDKDQLFFCFCVNANLYIEGRVPDIPAFRKQKFQIVLGTDSLASNHQLNMLNELITIKKMFPEIPTSELLVWATSNGAKALSFGGLGSFSVGTKPAVVLIENLHSGEITEQSISRKLL